MRIHFWLRFAYIDPALNSKTSDFQATYFLAFQRQCSVVKTILAYLIKMQDLFAYTIASETADNFF